MKKVTDERLLELLAIHGTVRQTAIAANLSERAIFGRLKDPDFKRRFVELKTLAVDGVATQLSNSLSDCVNLLQNTVNNIGETTNVRIQAADALLRHGLRYLEFCNLSERIAALESKLKESEEAD